MSLALPSSRPAMRERSADSELDLPALGAALWRQKWKILRPTIAVALLTFIVVEMITPRYLSESRVFIEGRDNIFLRPEADKDIIDRNTVDEQAVTSQVQLILSRDLAREVVTKLKLGERPEFDSTLNGVSSFKALLGLIGVIKNPMNMTPEERVLEAYYDRLTVYAVEKSRVILIDFLSEDPELSARVANAIADGYLALQRQAKQDQARSAGVWLAGELETMRKKVSDAESKVEAFRAKTNLLVGTNNTTLSAQQLGEFNTQLAAARMQRADAEAKAKLIREMLRSGQPIESSDVLNSELIRRLSEQRVTLRAQLAEQSSSLLSGHPRIKELKAQIADLDTQIREEAAILARSFENDAKLASARVDAQVASFDQLKNQAATTNEEDVQLRALEREAKSQRDLLESYLAKYREATSRDTVNSAPADARVISRATVSNVPAYPKKLPTVAIASLATLVLCTGMVLTRELLAAPGTAAPAEPVEPAANARRRRPFGPSPDLDAAPEPAEASPARMRSLAARLRSVVPGGQRARQEPQPLASREPPQPPPAQPQAAGMPLSAIEDFAHDLHAGASGGQIAVFGAAPQLQTGWIAVKFARALATEARVVLVGLDDRDPAIAEISSEPGAPGLAELATGRATFADIITRDRASGLDLIAAGHADASRGAILSAPGMARNFLALAHAYPHVVIAAGPLGGRDMETLASLAPHAILVVEAPAGAIAGKARDTLLDAGFANVTIVIAGRAESAAAA